MNAHIGVCSWSLQPTSVADLVEKLAATGAKSVQLALDPLRTGYWPEEETVSALSEAGIEIRSGMMTTLGEDYTSLESIERTGGVTLDENWDANLAAASANAALARRLGISLVTFHAGFIPHEADDPRRSVLIERLRKIIDAFAEHDVELGLETGQESAETLALVLAALERETVGVNFDPANMILYAMGDPVVALRDLAPRVRQIHVKDALPSPTPGTWGEEVRVGTGAVNWRAFFSIIRKKGLQVDFMIEREAGADRVGDIRAARKLVLEECGRKS